MSLTYVKKLHLCPCEMGGTRPGNLARPGPVEFNLDVRGHTVEEAADATMTQVNVYVRVIPLFSNN